MVRFIIALVAAYLLGSINFAVLMGSLFLKKDVRELGSGNAGATNVLRNAGVLPGILTFLLDAVKGFAAVWLAKWLLTPEVAETLPLFRTPIEGIYLCGIACVVGHIFPLFFHFRGGKGVAVCVGIFAVCCPKAIIIGLCVFALLVVFTKIVSLSSLSATATVVIGSFLFANPQTAFWKQGIMSLCMGFLIFWKHKDNIVRLCHGTESRIGGKKNG